MKLSPIQPRITTNAPEVTAHTAPHAFRTKSFSWVRLGGGSGEDVAHQSPGLAAALGDFRSGNPLHHAAQGPVGALDQPPGSGPGPAVRVQGAQHLVPQPPGLVDGYQGVEDVALAAAGAGHGQRHEISLLRVQLRLLVQGRVLEGVLPTLGELLLPALDPVGLGDPLAGVRVADGVVESTDLEAEHRTGDELALLLPLHHLPVLVDQPDVVSARGLGQSNAAHGDGDQGRNHQRRRQGNHPADGPGFGSKRQVVHLSVVSAAGSFTDAARGV